jgi:hypothetical protein
MALEVLERANLHSNFWKTQKVIIGMYDFFKTLINFQMIYSYIIFRFSNIFYIDATNQQTLEADLMAISPPNIEQSVAACCQWLASQNRQNWLLFFDNADDVQLNIAIFFPDCRFGNILVTTRNPQLSIYAGKDADTRVAGMDLEDAKCLLMQMSRAEKHEENEKLAALVVKVFFFFLTIIFNLTKSQGTSLFSIGHLSSQCFYSPPSLLLIKKISEALPITS